MKVLDAHSILDLNGTVTRFRVKSWSLSDSAFVVRTSATGSSRSVWTVACGRFELHVAERASIEDSLAELPPGSRSLVLGVGENRVAAIGCLAR